MNRNRTRAVAMIVPAAMLTATLAASPVQARSTSPVRLDADAAGEVSGEGALSCLAAVGGASLLAPTLVASVVGSLIIVCGCAEYFDAWFGTNFTYTC